MYKVIVSHPDTEPMINTKEIYDSAVALYTAECRNAAGYLANKPGKSVEVKLIKPDDSLDRRLFVTACTV